MKNQTLSYRTFDELLSDASVDLPILHAEGFIKSEQLIKIALRVNYDLGLKIHQEKETFIDINRRKGALPDDFHLFNFGLVCLHYTIEEPVITGTQTQDVLFCPTNGVIPSCQPKPAPCITKCGDHYYLKQTFKSHIRVYDSFAPIHIRAGREISLHSPNTRYNCELKGYIKDKCVHVEFDHGTIYMNYLGNMEDADGNLLVPDHPFLNEYYEYALKQRILENMMFAGEDVTKNLQLVELRIRGARNNALSVVNTPDFEEIKQTWEMNRRAMFEKYYRIFI